MRAALLVPTSLFLLLPAAAQTTAATPSAAASARVARQNDVFERYYQWSLRNHPISATMLGDYRYNDRLPDVSLEATRREHVEGNAFLSELRAISVDGMTEQDRLSHDLLANELADSDEGYALKEFEMPVSQMDSPATFLADLPLSMPFDSVKHYEDYIARLHGIPRVLKQTEEVMRAGQRDGFMPVKFLLEQVPVQCEGVIHDNPYLIPTTKYPASIFADQQKRLTAQITQVIQDEVFPAYRQFARYVQTEYLPKGRTAISVQSLPGGKARYAYDVRTQTNTSYTPAQIHEIGLKEVARINAEMTDLATKQGFPSLEAWRKAINADPRWRPKDGAQIVADFRQYIAGMQPKLPELFGILPKAPVTVEPIPDFQPTMATHYNPGTVDGSHPGRVVVAVANAPKLQLVDDESTAYHEGIPGHHMQISISQELTNLPKFRTQLLGYNAYVEGWALYAEGLGKEIGFYQDPVSDYGRLYSEMFRAVRLVVDTGIHDQGWTRQQVVDYMKAADINDTLAQSETDRYISWPGQALGYKLGQLKILELRARAKEKLGVKFDIRAFHDEILDGGALPLDVLDARIDRWIASQTGTP